MTDEHERLMAAARASVTAAGELGLPADNPERGVQHDALMHLQRIEASNLALGEQVEKGEKANREMREAVIRHAGRLTIVVRGGIVLALLTIALGYVFINRNREAIRVSCTLLGNAIIESGAARGPEPTNDPRVAARQELNTVLIGAIAARVLDAKEQRRVAELQAIIGKGGSLTLPRCEDVVRHPGDVKSLLREAKP